MTTAGEIAAWFDRGAADGATHMIVVVDRFDHSNFPVYVWPDHDPHAVHDEWLHKPMHGVMEVYDLAGDKAAQLGEDRAYHLPPGGDI